MDGREELMLSGIEVDRSTGQIHICIEIAVDIVYFSERKGTIRMLDEPMRDECTCPIGFASFVIDGGVVIVTSGRAPAPDIAVGTVGSCFAGIETAAVEVPLVVIRPDSYIIGGAGPEFVEGVCFEILHSSNLAVQFTIDEIPPVAHFEDIGALVEAIPHSGHKDAVIIPMDQVIGSEVREHIASVLAGSDKHMV